MRLETAVRRALRGVELTTADAGARELALTYARELDAAEVIHAQLVKVMREVLALDVDVHDRLLGLAVQIEKIRVLDDLGPKLLAALDALGLTPKARGSAKGGGRAGGTNPLDDLRQRRAARQRDPATVDPAAP